MYIVKYDILSYYSIFMPKETLTELSAIDQKIADKMCKYEGTQPQSLIYILEEPTTAEVFIEGRTKVRTQEKIRAEKMLTLIEKKMQEVSSDTETQIAQVMDDFTRNSRINTNQCAMNYIEEDLQDPKFRIKIKETAEEILALFQQREEIVKGLEAK